MEVLPSKMWPIVSVDEPMPVTTARRRRGLGDPRRGPYELLTPLSGRSSSLSPYTRHSSPVARSLQRYPSYNEITRSYLLFA